MLGSRWPGKCAIIAVPPAFDASVAKPFLKAPMWYYVPSSRQPAKQRANVIGMFGLRFLRSGQVLLGERITMSRF